MSFHLLNLRFKSLVYIDYIFDIKQQKSNFLRYSQSDKEAEAVTNNRIVVVIIINLTFNYIRALLTIFFYHHHQII